MGNRLPHGLGMSSHWLDMLGGVEGEVNVSVGGVFVFGGGVGARHLKKRAGAKPALTHMLELRTYGFNSTWMTSNDFLLVFSGR